MKNLIKALQIFLKYEDMEFPTHCEHDVLTICLENPEKVSEEDVNELLTLGFFYNDSEDCFQSYHYGSA